MLFLMASAVWTAIGLVAVVGSAVGGAYILGRRDGQADAPPPQDAKAEEEA